MNRGSGTVVIALLMLAACHKSERPRLQGQLSDQEVLAYASRPYDKREMMQQSIFVGWHSGGAVVAEFPCSDICPDYTVRVIHYKLAPGEQCSARGGIERELKVPAGRAMHEERFCFPKVLVDNWGAYLK